ncbi:MULTISPECIES: SEL1-like repeat protein [unclassified Gilliamella]|uniref:SEL1-like repeat protein n=1 Tax=unclassified Gilliamella TaxID=2685620 RepID=UPI00132ABD5E|nr:MULTISPECIES: SEL1-like repeat protein [unclassified Gilliamella]MWN31306.1 hypothetical protein [Gilliamella sp. Pra-s60]MWP29086.1 hypothetical protein [Gilliamella sp. Pra-s54]
MIQKICLFVLVFIFSPAVFSSSDFSIVVSSLEKNKNKQNQKELNQVKDDLLSIRKLATAYVDLANNLSSKDCNKLKKLYNLITTKKTEFTLYYDPESDYDEEGDSESNDKKFGCKTLSDDKINYILLPKLIGKGVSLYKTAILGGDIESISILLNRFKSQEIPYSYFIPIASMEDENLNDNPYANFLLGQLYIDDYFFTYNPEKAITFFDQAKDIQHHDLWYFLAFAKIEDVIAAQHQSINHFYLRDNVTEDWSEHADAINQIEEKLEQNDFLSISKLSYYYADEEKLNKAIEYFEKACELEASRACDLYEQQLNQPNKNKIYSLLRKFDKNNPDIKVSIDIAKWYEDLGKNLTAIDYYSYVVYKDPELLLKIAKLFKKANIKSSGELNDALIKTYTKYDSYVDNADIKYKIFLLYYPSMKHDDPTYEVNKIGLEWLEKAAKAGSAEARLAMAERFKTGSYLPKDYSKALYWYGNYCSISVKIGFPFEEFCEPFLYGNKEVFDLLAKANSGDKNAQYKLGEKIVALGQLYEIGLYYLALAADQGHEKAKILYLINKDRHWINFSG